VGAVPSILVLAKAPAAGEVKSRLAATIGSDQALAVYRALLARTAWAVEPWPGPVSLLVAGEAGRFDDTPLARLPRTPQADGGLGARLAAAFTAATLPAIAIGTDCPGLMTRHLARIADSLLSAPVAFGPARDGGYWSIGIRDTACVPLCCADDLPWSRPTLLAETRSRLAASGIQPALGDELDDLDDEADLRRAEAAGFQWRRGAVS
jgi:rSAM/selenodomain-associated transferase 1